MHKWLAVFAIAASAAVIPLTCQPNQATNQKQATAKRGQPLPVPSPPEEHDGCEHDKGKANADPPVWYTAFERPEGMLVIVGIVTCFVIGWQSIETRRAAKAANRQADTATDTAKRQLRAYLCVDQACVKITGEMGEPIRLEAQLHIKNGGQTPAYDVESWLHGHIGSYPENAPIPPPPEGMPKGIAIIPAQGKNIFASKEIAIYPQIMDDLETPTIPAVYYVQGEVRYRDIFKDWHRLKIRMFYGGPAKTRKTKDSNGVTMGFLGPDSWGNSEEDIPQANEGQKPD